MGRKKRKLVDDTVDEGPPLEDAPISAPVTVDPALAPPVLVENVKEEATVADIKIIEEESEAVAPAAEPLKSGYAMTSHSAEVIDADVYVSDGSDEEDEEDVALRNIEMVLAGSRMGIMRRGIHHPLLMQPNRQWVKDDSKALQLSEDDTEIDAQAAEEKRLREQEEELAKLDPAQRAARLLAEKQRKLEEAKINARRMESEENAGRDPCLFSKRTAFDIRFDQIDDKPWTRGGDMTDFFNYGLTEEDWLEYAQQQLMIRQELTDASRQRRPPDPTIVPVTPRTPSQQAPKVAVVAKTDGGDDDIGASADSEVEAKEQGPVLVKQDQDGDQYMELEKGPGPDKPETKVDVPVLGGAWGAGAAPGSMLAKLIEEQEKLEAAPVVAMDEDSKYGPASTMENYHDDQQSIYSRSEQDQNYGDDHASVRSSHSAQQEWNAGVGHYGAGGQQWDQYNSGRGGRGGGRGFFGGRSGGGRGGRGSGFRDNRYQGRGPAGFQDGGGGGDQYRKRPRDDHVDNRSGGWRR